MKKIILVFCLIALVAGCTSKQMPTPQRSSNGEEISEVDSIQQEITEIDDLEEELGLKELEDLENELENLI
jgi:hypothetical protein